MENNEDKRTPIAQAIVDVENRIISIEERRDKHADDIIDADFIIANMDLDKCNYALRILQSLLKPEKEALIKAANVGIRSMPMVEIWFASTYTQQTK